MHVSEASKTRKFKAQAEGATTPFVRVTEDATVRFSRPYEKVEITDPGPDPIRVELDLSSIAPIDDTLPFAIEDVPVERASEPYALIELQLSVPEVAEPLLPLQPVLPPAPKSRFSAKIALVTALVMITAFAAGMGVVLAVSN